MKGCLIRKDCPAPLVYFPIPTANRQVLLELGTDAKLLRGLSLFLQVLHIPLVAAVTPLKLRYLITGEVTILALDTEALGDFADVVKCPGVAIRSRLGAVVPVLLQYVDMVVVESVGKVSGVRPLSPDKSSRASRRRTSFPRTTSS